MGPFSASILYSAKIQHPRDALATYCYLLLLIVT